MMDEIQFDNFYKNKRILITGAAGFVGSNLLKYFSQRGIPVHVILKKSTDFWRIKDDPNYSVHYSDMLDYREVISIFKAIRPEIVFHVASGGGHPQDPQSFLHYSSLQTGMTLNLARASCELGIEQFVHTGSSLEAEVSDHTVYENYALKPLTYRGITKATESMICHYYAHHAHLPLMNARLFGVYGPFEQASRVIPTFIMRFLQHKPLSIASDEYRRDYIFVNDVVNGLLSCGSAKNVPPGTLVNLGSSDLFSARDIYEILKDIFGYDVPVIPIPHVRKAVDNVPYKADTSVARELLNFMPAFDMKSGLKYTVEWFRSNAHFYE